MDHVAMTQASCEADVLSCYYLQALSNTEAVRLVMLPLLFVILSFHPPISFNFCSTFLIENRFGEKYAITAGINIDVVTKITTRRTTTMLKR